MRIFDSIPDLEQLRAVWYSWCHDPNADPDFYLAAARARPDFERPHVIVIYRGNTPDCMLVGRLEQTTLDLKLGYTTLFKPSVRRLFFVQGGFLGNQSQENSEYLICSIMQSLQKGEAHTAEFARQRIDSTLYRTAKEVGFLQRGHFSPVHQHRSLRLPDTFDKFVRGMSRHNRHEFRRHEKQIADVPGAGQVHCYRSEDEVADLVREVEKVAKQTYQRGVGAGFRTDRETLEFLKVAARKGELRGCVMHIAAQPCAFFVGNRYKETFHGRFMGFDPRFASYSPGLMVLMHSIEECFEPHTRATQMDFGWGDRRYKRAVCNEVWQDGPIYLYPVAWKGTILNLARSLTSFLDLIAREIVSSSTTLLKVKKAWQRCLTSASMPHFATELDLKK